MHVCIDIDAAPVLVCAHICMHTHACVCVCVYLFPVLLSHSAAGAVRAEQLFPETFP
jgi:hypothetical protein